jgi:FkbM family methyltransferase
MRRKRVISAFLAAYDLLRTDKLLSVGPFRTAFVHAYFLYKKVFEDPFLNLIERNPQIFQGGDILDIGANIGYTACIFARAVKNGAKVFAFEPDDRSRAILKEVVRRKGLKGTVEPIGMAVGDSDGQIKFWHNERHSADHRVITEQFKNSGPDNSMVSVVPVTSVDTFVRNRGLGNISFIKIDVQGYELAVCEGMKETLESFPNLCTCLEYCPDAMVELGFDPMKLTEFFLARGYRLYTMTDGDLELSDEILIKHKVNEQGYIDFLCSRRPLT